MTINLLIAACIFCCAICISVIILTLKKDISIKFALIWIILFTILLLFIFIPGLLSLVTNILGFQTASNMILSLFIALLIAINIASTVAISRKSKQIINLTQELAIIKDEVKNINNNKKNNRN